MAADTKLIARTSPFDVRHSFFFVFFSFSFFSRQSSVANFEWVGRVGLAEEGVYGVGWGGE